MNEERLQILKMVAEGKVSPEEGARLLEAVGEKTPALARERPRWLRVRVFEGGREAPTVNVNLPLSLVDVALGLVPEGVRVHALKGFDLKALLEQLKEEGSGKIIEVNDQDDGDRVEIAIE